MEEKTDAHNHYKNIKYLSASNMLWELKYLFIQMIQICVSLNECWELCMAVRRGEQRPCFQQGLCYRGRSKAQTPSKKKAEFPTKSEIFIN